MKIACSILGTEGLQSTPAPVHFTTGHFAAGMSTASFAESLGESLAAKIVPEASEKSIKPETLLAKADKTDWKMFGNPKEHPVEPALSGHLKTIAKSVVVPNEQDSLAKPVTSAGTTSDEISATPVQSDVPEKVSSAKVPEIPKSGGQALVADESTEAQTGSSVEQESVSREPVVAVSNGRDHRALDPTKKTEDGAKASSSPAEKEKETKVSPHHKAKRDSEELTANGQGLQQSSPGDSSAMVQTIATAGPVPTGLAVPQTAPGESLQDSPVDIKQVEPSGRKAVVAHGVRKGQQDQPALKQPHGPVGTAGEAAERTAEAPFREGKTLAEATASRAVAGEDKASVEEKAHRVLEAAPAAVAGGLQPSLHAPVPQSSDKIATPLPAHLIHTPQSDSPVSRTMYTSAEHGATGATPAALEVSVPGGTHGWLKVRAELGSDGSVHASMSSNSAAGTEALRRDLPQLTSYLHQEQVRVSSVVVHSPHRPAEFLNQASGDGRGQIMDGSSSDAHRGDTGGGGRGASHSQAQIRQTSLRPEADGDLLPRGFGSAGGWLSVRA